MNSCYKDNIYQMSNSREDYKSRIGGYIIAGTVTILALCAVFLLVFLFIYIFGG